MTVSSAVSSGMIDENKVNVPIFPVASCESFVSRLDISRSAVHRLLLGRNMTVHPEYRLSPVQALPFEVHWISACCGILHLEFPSFHLP